MSDLDKYMYINILDFNKKCHVHILCVKIGSKITGSKIK